MICSDAYHVRRLKVLEAQSTRHSTTIDAQAPSFQRLRCSHYHGSAEAMASAEPSVQQKALR